jgi:hypothetical protein
MTTENTAKPGIESDLAPPPATIPLQAIESSQIAAYGYDAASNTLAIQFKPKGKSAGGIYHYANVGPTEWAAFRDAESKGSHFFKAIKAFPDRYPYTRLPAADTETPEVGEE